MVGQSVFPGIAVVWVLNSSGICIPPIGKLNPFHLAVERYGILRVISNLPVSTWSTECVMVPKYKGANGLVPVVSIGTAVIVTLVTVSATLITRLTVITPSVSSPVNALGGKLALTPHIVNVLNN